MKTSWDGAQTSIHCAVDPMLANHTGRYYADCRETEPIDAAKDMNMARKLWELSEKTVGL